MDESQTDAVPPVPSEVIKAFRSLFWAARREHLQGAAGAQHQKATEYAREHGLPWAETLLEASLRENQADDGAALEAFLPAEQTTPGEVRDLFLFLKGLLLAKEERWDEAIGAYREALAQPGNDAPDCMWTNLGIALRHNGQYEEAVAAIRKALADPRNDRPAYDWCNLGTVLTEMGRYGDAIEAYQKALADPTFENPAHVWHNLGKTLTEEGQYEQAIAAYQKAMADPRVRSDGRTAVGMAVAYHRAGRKEDALRVLAEVLEKPDEFPEAAPLARTVLGLIEADLPETSLSPGDRAILETGIPAQVAGAEERILAKIRSAKQTAYDDYMERRSSPRDNIISILRGWSSAVTLLEGSERLWRGGGYFVKWQGKGIVVDPGFDFLRNFHDAGYHAREIDGVLVSHNHSDHNADLRSIDDLRYELYKRRGKDPRGVIGPYVLVWDADTQASVRFAIEDPEHQFKPILFDVGRCNPCDTIASPHALPVAVEYFPVQHKVSIHDPVGFKLRLAAPDGSALTVGYTGDTEFFPELAHHLAGCNLLIAHISEPEEKELSNPAVRKKNHLGYRGLIELINRCKPEAVVVSEFWAGLADSRIDLVQGIRALTRRRAILPGGIGMHIHLPDLQLECTQCAARVPFGDVHVAPPPMKFGHLAYLCPQCVLD